jgi:hypothetical protein
MKKQIIITLILLIATAYVTIVYFKNLNPPGTHTSRVMNEIPDNASLVFEFNNDQSFYDIFRGSKLFVAFTGQQVLGELDTLKQLVLQNPSLDKFFSGQNIFISVHPDSAKNLALLITASAANGFGRPVIDQLAKQPNTGLQITQMHFAGKLGYSINILALRKTFYLLNKDNNVFSGSFSKALIDQSAVYKNKKSRESFVLLPEQQNANSLANIYVNYTQLNPLFDLLFKNKNTDIFKSFRLLGGYAALSLNYKTDALMFSGITSISLNQAAAYLNLFANQQPVANHLKDLFPSTTAYATNFSVSDPLKFGRDLSQWYYKAGLKNEKDQLFNKIQAETGTNLQSRFNNLLGNEFAVVTTRYFEKLAIVSVKDGSKMNSLLMNISKGSDANTGQFSYDKLPFFLLGDAFGMFRHPYYLIIDNYLILANSNTELKSYYDSYINRKFLSKNEQYQQFDNLVAAQSNVAFLLVFKNAEPILKRDLNDNFYNNYKDNDAGWANFYGASWQFSAADKNFYTNFSLRLNTDTALVKN